MIFVCYCKLYNNLILTLEHFKIFFISLNVTYLTMKKSNDPIRLLLSLLIMFFSFGKTVYSQVLRLNGTALTASGGSPSNCTAGGYKTLNSATVSGNCVTFTTGGFQNGAIWACSGINLNH